MTKTATPNPKRVITPTGILSYPHLFEPHAGPSGGAAKYSCTIVFPKGTNLADLKAAVVAAGEEKWGTKFEGGVRAGKIKLPFREDADKGYEEGSVFINVRSGEQPQIVSRVKDDKTGKATFITEAKEMYPGAQVRASITAFAYDTNGNRGVSFGLNNIQKVADGARLDNRKSAQDDFEADLSAEPASLDDLM